MMIGKADDHKRLRGLSLFLGVISVVGMVSLTAFSVLGLGCSQPAPKGEEAPAAATEASEPESALPNIVFIIVDTLRADRVSMSRDDIPLMPFMDAFAKESLSFSRALAQAPWTRPSMASIFTSLYPGVHNQQFGIKMEVVAGQDHTVDTLSEDFETMAEYFKAFGYTTVGVQANWNMQPLFGVAQGFDEYEMIDREQNAVHITDLCLGKAAALKPPYFLFVHYIEPHAPYAPPEVYRRMFPSVPEISDQDHAVIDTYATGYYPDKVRWDLHFRDAPPEAQLSEAGKAYIQAMYDGEVRFADDEVGRLIRGLREKDPRSLIVFSADHGEELWEHGSVGHGKTLYEEVLHVPLIFSFPDMPARAVETPAQLIDILPTLADKIGLPQRDWWQGRNLLSEEWAGRENLPVFAETRTSVREANVFLMTLIEGNTKLILDQYGQESWRYDLVQDPREQHPLTDDGGSAALRLKLRHYLEENQAHPLYASPTINTVVDEETRDMLKAQGYF